VCEWQKIGPERQRAIVTIEGALSAEAVGSHQFGDPMRRLPWLANYCAARCGGLGAGDVVATGAWTGVHIVRRGAAIVVRFPGIAEACVVFTENA
jgi:2-keto-4-pentenoate hydratase